MLSSKPSVCPDDDLFRFANGARPGPRIINQITKNICKRCGLDPKLFAAHMLRAGGICDVLCAGVPDSICQILSRHASLESLKPTKSWATSSSAPSWLTT